MNLLEVLVPWWGEDKGVFESVFEEAVWERAIEGLLGTLEENTS